jgi:hypothetical protein
MFGDGGWEFKKIITDLGGLVDEALQSTNRFPGLNPVPARIP